MKKGYVCNRFPFLGIRSIQFRDGLYETEDENEQKLIEGNDWYGIHIHPRDHGAEQDEKEAPATMSPSERGRMAAEARWGKRDEGGVRHGTVGTK
jgi:hypothetical protein